LGVIVRVTYRYIRPVTVLFARSMGPYHLSSREAWPKLGAWLEQHKVRNQPKLGYGYFRDNPITTSPELLRYDACVPVIPGIDADAGAGIGRQTLPGGAFAVHTHVGSYNEVGEIFSRLHRDVVPKRGLAVDYERPFVAIYLNDPALTREVHRRTELCVPVIPVRMPLSCNDDDAATVADVRQAG
jgi:AraC family transcriptional regulator